jgi:hypothetical protein
MRSASSRSTPPAAAPWRASKSLVMYRTGPMRSRAVEQGEAGLRAAISGARVCFTEETLPFWMRGNLNRFVEVKKNKKH